MGLGWKDAVALLGAHTLGRGDREDDQQVDASRRIEGRTLSRRTTYGQTPRRRR